jgi:hypothetical protein
MLDKEATSYNDIFDAFRLALKFYHFQVLRLFDSVNINWKFKQQDHCLGSFMISAAYSFNVYLNLRHLL